jgi:hypothetical protein
MESDGGDAELVLVEKSDESMFYVTNCVPTD